MKKMRFNALCLHLKGLSEKRENRIERTKYQREMIKKTRKSSTTATLPPPTT